MDTAATKSLFPQRKAFLSTGEVARWLGTPPRTVRLWAELNEIPAVKMGRQWRFLEDQVRQWIAQHDPSATSRPAK